ARWRGRRPGPWPATCGLSSRARRHLGPTPAARQRPARRRNCPPRRRRNRRPELRSPRRERGGQVALARASGFDGGTPPGSGHFSLDAFRHGAAPLTSAIGVAHFLPSVYILHPLIPRRLFI